MSIHIYRDPDGAFILRHDEPLQDALIYVGIHPDAIDQPVARASGTQEVVVRGLEPHRRYYFAVMLDDGRRMVVAERRVSLEGSLNFRDLGGYHTADGRQVRWGRVFRSDALDRLTDEDLTVIDGMGLRLICDLRGDAEAQDRASRITAPQHPRFNIKDEVVTGRMIRQRIESGETEGLNLDLMMGSYRRLLDGFAPQFGAVLRLLAEEDNLPALFHCTAGKDRTGMTAAMLLTLLGVPHETIRQDYALTNGFVAPFMEMVRSRVEAVGIDFEPLRAIFGAPLPLIDAAFDHLEATYGGVRAYLQDQAGVDETVIAALQANLLM